MLTDIQVHVCQLSPTLEQRGFCQNEKARSLQKSSDGFPRPSACSVFSRLQQFFDITVAFKVCEMTECMRRSSMLRSKPTPHTSLFPSHHRPRYRLCATWSHPTSFAVVKVAQYSTPGNVFTNRLEGFRSNGWSSDRVIWWGILSMWHGFFRCSGRYPNLAQLLY